MATVGDLMSTPPVTCPPDTSLAHAALVMQEAGIGSVVVVQGAKVVGILTERDVLRAAASGADLRGSAVTEWMTPDPQSASPDESAEEAAQLMLLNGFRHLPVVEDREVCGVVSLRDLFAARIRR